MSSLVTTLEAPLGSKDNPHPFVLREKRTPGEWYFGLKGIPMKCYQTKNGPRLRRDRKIKITPKTLIDNRKPLGSKENPHPFEKGKKNRIAGDYYLNIRGYPRICKKNGKLKINGNKKIVRESTIKNRLCYLLETAKSTTKKRAKKGRNYNIDIDLEYLLELWKKCNGICFRFKKKMSLLDNDVWLVSLDRIDPSNGYIKGNVQLVSLTYNLMKGDKTEEQMDKVFDQLRLVYSNTSL